MTILLFIVILAFLILSHEFGHFIIAKKSGIRVEEFGLGFPPRLYGIKKGDTLYSINLIPFGGFVKIEGEEGEHPNDPKSFAAKPAYIKAAVLVAGVAFNLLSAYLLFAVISWAGTPTNIGDENPPGVRDVQVLVGSVDAASPASDAGLVVGDSIIRASANNQSVDIQTISDLQIFIEDRKGEIIDITLLRGENEETIPIFARANPPPQEGPLGISLLRVGIVKSPWYEALWDGFVMLGRSMLLVVSGFYDIIRIALAGEDTSAYLAGPIGIVGLVGQSLDLGFLFLLQFTAILAVHLAIINLVPFPALDGGRLFFLFIETIIRRPLPRTFTNYANTLGFFFLIGLMLLITVADVKKLF
ncbi:MAG: site-2 protease family protein [bacterium]|nr:site-2 protease family protein [bacterium]